MWRTSHHLLKKTITSAARTSHGSRPVPGMDILVGSSSGSTRMVGVGYHHRPCTTPGSASWVGCRVGSDPGSGQKMGCRSHSCCYSTTSSCNGEENKNVNSSSNNNNGDFITHEEAKRLMRLVNVEELKWKLGMENNEVIGYNELLTACTKMGVAKTHDEAVGFARVLDDAGVILLFRDKVYLHPDKVVDEIRKAVPLALRPEDDPTIHELKNLQEKKDKIDELAHKQVRRILWTGLGAGLLQVGLFFRLTFWEFSWDVMEPIAFFTTTTGIVIGYAYFLVTSRDPSYQDVLKRLFLSRQRKLIKKNKFDIQRFVELQKKIKLPVNNQASMKHRLGVELEPEDLLHGH